MEYYVTTIISNQQIASDIYLLKVKWIGEKSKPGQFFMLKAWDAELTLSRPISVFKMGIRSLSFMYRVIGQGTEYISRLKRGDYIELTGPLGNGFPIDILLGKVALVGGGIGIPPMYETAKALTKKGVTVDCYFGYRDETFAFEDFEDVADDIYISTESGSEGVKGFVTQMLKPQAYDAVLCCGPEMMIKAIIKLCQESHVPIWVSMEKRMACGIGACLGCNCETTTGMKRCCKEGPVFNGNDLII